MPVFALIILALILPWLAIALADGFKLNFYVNLALHIFAVIMLNAYANPIPGLITVAHAIWVICTTD